MEKISKKFKIFNESVGLLKGFDQLTNMVIENCTENVYSPIHGVKQVLLGLFIVRGNNVCLVGDYEGEYFKEKTVKANPIKTIDL
jgi:U6 snRNA-associated Sm-like protein LSm8